MNNGNELYFSMFNRNSIHITKLLAPRGTHSTPASHNAWCYIREEQYTYITQQTYQQWYDHNNIIT